MQFVNDPAPWWDWARGRPLSIADLIANGTITAQGAALLWWSLEQGASVFVAAGPQGAGKTTLATALFSFLPADARAYVTAGPRDPLAIPTGPEPVYLLINELSNHLPFYLYGPAATRAFALLRDGVRAIGALHARSAAEAVAVMHAQAGVPYADIARVTLIVVLHLRRGARGLERRVTEIGRLEATGTGVRVVDVALWDMEADRLVLAPPPGGIATLAAWAAVPVAAAERGIDRRTAFLERLVRDGGRSIDETTAAVRQFRAP